MLLVVTLIIIILLLLLLLFLLLLLLFFATCYLRLFIGWNEMIARLQFKNYLSFGFALQGNVGPSVSSILIFVIHHKSFCSVQVARTFMTALLYSWRVYIQIFQMYSEVHASNVLKGPQIIRWWNNWTKASGHGWWFESTARLRIATCIEFRRPDQCV